MTETITICESCGQECGEELTPEEIKWSGHMDFVFLKMFSEVKAPHD